MILVDSSIWIDQFRIPVPALQALVDQELVLTHDLVIGELALGSIKDREAFLDFLSLVKRVVYATHEEVLALVEGRRLYGRGIGFVDAHLLASTLLTEGARLWSFDRRLRVLAAELNCAADLPGKTPH